MSVFAVILCYSSSILRDVAPLVSKIVISLEDTFSQQISAITESILDEMFLTQDDLDEAEAEMARLEAEETAKEEEEEKRKIAEAAEQARRKSEEEEAKKKAEEEAMRKAEEDEAMRKAEEEEARRKVEEEQEAKKKAESEEAQSRAESIEDDVSVVAESQTVEEPMDLGQEQESGTTPGGIPAEESIATATMDTDGTNHPAPEPAVSSTAHAVVPAGSQPVPVPVPAPPDMSSDVVEKPCSEAAGGSGSSSPTPVSPSDVHTEAVAVPKPAVASDVETKRQEESMEESGAVSGKEEVAQSEDVSLEQEQDVALTSSQSPRHLSDAGSVRPPADDAVQPIEATSSPSEMTTLPVCSEASERSVVELPASPAVSSEGTNLSCPASVVVSVSPPPSISTSALPVCNAVSVGRQDAVQTHGEVSAALTTKDESPSDSLPGLGSVTADEGLSPRSPPACVSSPTSEQDTMRQVLNTKIETVARRSVPVLSLQKMTSVDCALQPVTTDTKDKGIASAENVQADEMSGVGTGTACVAMDTSDQTCREPDVAMVTGDAELDKTNPMASPCDTALSSDANMADDGEEDDDVSSVHTSDLSSFDSHISDSTSSSLVSSRATSPSQSSVPASKESLLLPLQPKRRRGRPSSSTKPSQSREKAKSKKSRLSASKQADDDDDAEVSEIVSAKRPRRSSRPTRRYSPSDAMFSSATEEARKRAAAVEKEADVPPQTSTAKPEADHLSLPVAEKATTVTKDLSAPPAKGRTSQRLASTPLTPVAERRRHSSANTSANNRSDSPSAKRLRSRAPVSSDSERQPSPAAAAVANSSPAKGSPVRMSARLSTQRRSSS